MLLSYRELCDLVKRGILENVDPDNINGSSIDVNLGPTIMVEDRPDHLCPSCGAKGLCGRVNFNDPTESLYCTTCHVHNAAWKWVPVVDPAKKQSLKMRTIDISREPYILLPGHACLAHTTQLFHLPADVSADFVLKSSQARVFLEHLHAGWADAWWNNSALTLEFVNLNRYHAIALTAGSKCGQIRFWWHDPVPKERGYAVRGQYNGDQSVSESKGVK